MKTVKIKTKRVVLHFSPLYQEWRGRGRNSGLSLCGDILRRRIVTPEELKTITLVATTKPTRGPQVFIVDVRPHPLYPIKTRGFRTVFSVETDYWAESSFGEEATIYAWFEYK